MQLNLSFCSCSQEIHCAWVPPKYLWYLCLAVVYKSFNELVSSWKALIALGTYHIMDRGEPEDRILGSSSGVGEHILCWSVITAAQL